jgi:hypothetical protein
MRLLAGLFGRQGGFHWPEPVLGIQAAPDAGFEGRMRPVGHMRDVLMFHRIEVDIVHMRSEILVVADGMLPEPPLPDAALPAAFARLRTALAHGKAAGENRLDQPPSHREVIIAGWQRPYAMKMIGKHDPGIDGERMDTMNRAHRVPQLIDVPRQHVIAAPLQQIDREEVASARHAVAAVIRNGCPPVRYRAGSCGSCGRSRYMRRVTLRFRPALLCGGSCDSCGGSRCALDPPYCGC